MWVRLNHGWTVCRPLHVTMDLSTNKVTVNRIVHRVRFHRVRFLITIKDKPLTRRGILSFIFSIYNPLGFTTAFTLNAKKLLQDLCKEEKLQDGITNFLRVKPILDVSKTKRSMRLTSQQIVMIKKVMKESMGQRRKMVTGQKIIARRKVGQGSNTTLMGKKIMTKRAVR